MRVVIDSNRLRSEELRWFLSETPSYAAVMTDYAWMEAYNGDSIVAIAKSLAILTDFPDQVLLLKGTKAIGAMTVSHAGMASRMIIPNSRREFRKTSTAIRELATGNSDIFPALLAHEAVAKDQMDRVLTDARQLVP